MLRKVLTFVFGAHLVRSAENLVPLSGAQQRAERERQLIEKEATIGGRLFGAVPEGRQRDFFCLDEHTWVWHESWFNPQTKVYEGTTVRYEIHQNGILKIVNGQPSGYLKGTELKHLLQAIKMYYEQVSKLVYSQSAHAA